MHTGQQYPQYNNYIVGIVVLCEHGVSSTFECNNMSNIAYQK